MIKEHCDSDFFLVSAGYSEMFLSVDEASAVKKYHFCLFRVASSEPSLAFLL
jgi:hypothetical protein